MSMSSRLALGAAAAGFAAFALLAFAPSASAGTDVGPAAIITDTTWALSGSPYYVNGPIAVLKDLHIDEGVRVLLNGNFAFTVSGSIHVAGTEANPVFFGSNNTSAVTVWAGILFQQGPSNVASAMANATFDRAFVALDIRQFGASIDLSDILITRAGDWGIKTLHITAPYTWSNITITDSANGAQLTDHQHLTWRTFNTANLSGGATPYALYGDRLATSDLYSLSFPGGRAYCVDCGTLGVNNIDVSNTTIAIGIEVLRPNALTFAGVRVRGFTDAGFSAESAIALTVYSVDIAPSGSTVATNALLFNACPGFHLSGGTVQGSTTGLRVSNSRDFIADNLSVNGSTTSVFPSDSPGFVLENSTLTNAPAVALDIQYSGGSSHVRNVTIATSTLGVHVAGVRTDLAIDFTTGNKINNAPVLGVFNTPMTTTNPASAYAWVYVFGSPNTVVTQANVPVGTADPALVWADSDFGQLDQSSVHGSGRGILVSRSNSMRVIAVGAFASAEAFRAVEGTALFVQDSVFRSTTADGGLLESETNAQLSNVTGIGATSGMHDWAGNMNVYTQSVFNGSSGFFADRTTQVEVSVSGLCGVVSAMMVDQGGDIGSLGNTFCANSSLVGVAITSSTRVRVENTSFDRFAHAVTVSGSTGTFVRWNEFRNCTIDAVRVTASSTSSIVYENNFYCGAASGYDNSAPANLWYNATRGHGNYWDDYTGSDTTGDFIGETPYNIPGGARRDLFPLVLPYETVPPIPVASSTTPIDEDTSSTLDASQSHDNVAIAGATWVIHDASGDVTRQGLTVVYLFATPGNFRCDVTVRDAWNNTAVGAAYVRVLDKTPPVIVPPTGPFAVDEDTDITLFAQVTDNDPAFPGGATFVWRITGRENTSATTSLATATFRFASPGAYAGNVTAYDAGGNFAFANFTLTVRDRTAPTFLFRATGAVPPGQGETVHLSMANAADNDPAFPGPGAFYWVIVFPGNVGYAENFNQSFDFTPAVPGNFSIRYECRDPSGNLNAGAYNFLAPDTEAPVWTPPAGVTLADGEEHTFSVEDATDYSGVASATWKDGSATVAATLAFTRTWTGLGNHEVSVVIEDGVGNQGVFSFTVTIVDRTAPHLLNATWARAIAVKQQQRIEFEAFNQFADNDPLFAANGKYAWSIDAPEVTWGSPLDATHAVLAVTSLGNFTLTLKVTDPAGNIVEIQIPVSISDGLPPSNVNWSVSPGTSVTLGTTVVFTATALDPSGVSYRWDFGDGETAEGPNASYAYVSSGPWPVTLTVTDGVGNEAVYHFTVVVTEGTLGSGGHNGGGNNNGGTANATGLPMMTILIIVAVVAAAGVGVMVVAFRRKLKKPAEKPVIIQQEAPPAADPWAKPPPSEYDQLYGPSTSYDPNERPPGSP